MTDENANIVLSNGDDMQEVSMLNLANLDISQVEAYRGGTPTPAGVYVFSCKDATLESMEIDEKVKGTATGRRINVATAVFVLTIENCLATKDPSVDPGSLIGTEHYERFFIRDAQKDIGRIVAFIQDAGGDANGAFADVLSNFQGHMFQAAVTNRKDKQDPDRVYANIDGNKVKPLDQGQAPAVPATQSAEAQAPAPNANPAAPAPTQAAPGGFKLPGQA